MIFGAFWCHFWDHFWEHFGRLVGWLAAAATNCYEIVWSNGCLWLARAVGGLSLLLFVVSLARPSRLWALSATFCGVFGSSGLFLGLGDRSGTVFYFIFGSFWVHFLKIRGG